MLELIVLGHIPGTEIEVPFTLTASFLIIFITAASYSIRKQTSTVTTERKRLRRIYDITL